MALIGVGYQVVVQGQFYNMYGTSASTPVLAGMVTLVNLQRARRGKGPVGSPNNCCSSCCELGICKPALLNMFTYCLLHGCTWSQCILPVVRK